MKEGFEAKGCQELTEDWYRIITVATRKREIR